MSFTNLRVARWALRSSYGSILAIGEILGPLRPELETSSSIEWMRVGQDLSAVSAGHRHDTIVLGRDAIAHYGLAESGRLAAAHLAAGGRLVYGSSIEPDAQYPAGGPYPGQVIEAFREGFSPRHVDIRDGILEYIGMVGPDEPSLDVPALMAAVEERLEEAVLMNVDAAASNRDSEQRLSRLLAEYRATEDELTEALRESAEASRQIDLLHGSLESELQRETARRDRVMEQVGELEREVEDLASRLAEEERHAADQAKRYADLERRLSSSAERIRVQRRRIDSLEDDRAKLRDRLALTRWKLALTRWKLASTTSRKWWRIGVAIGQVKSNLLRVFVLPFDIVSILFSKSNLPPRPQPTRVKSLKPTPSTSTQSKSVGAAPQPSPQGSAREGSPLVPMIVAAPASMSLAPPPITNLTDLRVAAILDDMSSQSFEPECSLVTFGPHNWLEVLERERPNLLLVESAWRGNGGSWEYKVGTYSYPESVGLPDLTALVDWCRAAGVPTVFWNKEDPVHFEKFKEAAALFDVVFTTDENMVGPYERLPGSDDRVIGVLPFAAQPAIHNPVGSLGDRDARPVFAGAYYRNRHHSRRDQLDMLLDAALPFDLMIYDRMGGAVSDSFGFPERFQANIVGTLPYEEMVQVYRTHRVFLNVNSVSDSPTMFSRRVFELLASGTPVVSTSSVGVEQMFGGVVDIVETEREANDATGRLVEDHDWWLDRSVRGIESVFASNTYADRLHTIAKTAGLSVGSAQPRVSIVVGPDFELVHMPRLDDANVVEILSIGGHLSEPDDRVRVPIRRIDVADHATSGDIGHAVAASASGDWLAFASAADDLRSLRSLATATRITPAEIYLPSPTWAQSHEYLDGIDTRGLVLASTDFVRRTSWSPWPAPGGSVVGGRIYSVPVVDG